MKRDDPAAYQRKYRAERPEYHQRVDQERRVSHTASNRARQALRRQEIQQIKLDRGCLDCGYNARYEALHFDHVPGRGPKCFEIALGTGRSRETLMAEIAKCDVVCANCHAIRTADRKAADAKG